MNAKHGLNFTYTPSSASVVNMDLFYKVSDSESIVEHYRPYNYTVYRNYTSSKFTVRDTDDGSAPILDSTSNVSFSYSNNTSLVTALAKS